LLAVFHAADFLSHERGKERINEIQNGLVTAEVVRQRDDLACVDESIGHPASPHLGVTLKYARIRETEAVNALLDVADEKTVCLGTLASECAENGVLSFINVL